LCHSQLQPNNRAHVRHIPDGVVSEDARDQVGMVLVASIFDVRADVPKETWRFPQ
jgi:hypothetical protein